MSKGLVLLFALILVLAAAGAVYLAAWDIPPPTRTVEKTLPDDRIAP